MRIISNDLTRKLRVLIKSSNFDVNNYLVFNELNKEQQKIIDNAISILKENTVDEVKVFGGNIEKNEEKLEKLKENIKKELENEEYNEIKNDLEKLINSYVKNFQLLIPMVCGAIIPVKQLPSVEVYFRTSPRIMIDNEKPEKMSIDDNSISYYGEIKCLIPRITLFGKIKDADPLFAPLIGDLDLGDFNPEKSEHKGPMIGNYSYITELITSMDKDTTKNNLTRYHEQYQRHGEPICDFLLKDKELMDAMEKLSSAIESKRTSSSVSICAIAVPNIQDKSTIVVVQDESKSPNAYATCFEALLRFSALCYEAPSTKKPSEVSTSPIPPTQAGQAIGPGGQRLEVWTQEELVKDAAERGLGTGLPPNMELWTEEQLIDMAKSRTDLGVNLPEWSEEELEKLTKSRQGTLNIPEWKDTGLSICEKCGYTLREGWLECPICNWKVGVPVPKEEQEKDSSDDIEKIKQIQNEDKNDSE